MAKMITRTVTAYTYKFGSFDFESNSVQNVESYRYFMKLKKRELDDLTESVGKPLLGIKEDTQLYGISIDDFMSLAKPVAEIEEVEED